MRILFTRGQRTNRPLYKFFTKNSENEKNNKKQEKIWRMRRVVGAEGKSTAAYIEVREDTFFPFSTH